MWNVSLASQREGYNPPPRPGLPRERIQYRSFFLWGDMRRWSYTYLPTGWLLIWGAERAKGGGFNTALLFLWQYGESPGDRNERMRSTS